MNRLFKLRLLLVTATILCRSRHRPYNGPIVALFPVRIPPNRIFRSIQNLFRREPFDFVEDEDASPDELVQAKNVLRRHRRRVSVFFRNSQIALQVAIGLKAGMYAVFIQQSFGLHAAAQLQTLALSAYFCLNIIMGVVADSIAGRRKVYLGGIILFTLSYALYGIGTWQSCQFAEVCFGSALACVSGVLSVWFRNIIENTFYLRSRVAREDIDNAMIASETNDYCRKSTRNVFGFRAIFMTISGVIGGFTAANISPTHVWFVATAICALLIGYVWWHMFHNTIPVRPRQVSARPLISTNGRLKRFWEHPLMIRLALAQSTVVGAWSTMRRNMTVLSFITIGVLFAMIIQVVKISWVPVLEPVMRSHGVPMWLATVMTIVVGVSGGVIVILFERTQRYKRKREEEQTKYDYLILRYSLFIIGLLLVVVRFAVDLYIPAVVLVVFLVGGVFARVHAGSITSNTPAKSRRKFGTTMLSIYETGVAATSMVASSGIAILLRQFNWQVHDILSLTGVLAFAFGIVVRYRKS